MTLSQIFSNDYIAGVVVRALIVGVLVALCASLLGVSLVLKRLSMIGDGLSHVGFGALAVATVLDMTEFSTEISIPIVVAAAFFLLKLGENGKIKGDAAIAMFSTGAIAVGSLLYNYTGTRNTDVCNSLFGSATIISLSAKDMIYTIVVSLLGILFYALFYPRIFAVTFDETFSRATGMKTELYKLLIAVFTAVTVVVGMKMVGAIMISALIVFPSLSAMRVCRSFKSVVLCSAGISVICFVIGFFTACIMGWQTGATVATVYLAAFLLISGGSALRTKLSVLKKRAGVRSAA